MQEAFQHRSQTKSKALFIFIFIIIGIFLTFKLTQDGSKYVLNSPNLPIKETEPAKSRDKDTNATQKQNNKDALNSFMGKIQNFNETLNNFSMKLHNYTNIAKDFLNQNEVFSEIISKNSSFIDKLMDDFFSTRLNINSFEEERKELIKKLEDLKADFEKASSNT